MTIKQFLPIIILCLAAIVYAGVGPVQQVASLTQLADAPNPYFVRSHFALLYIWVPIVTISTGAFLLAPGLLWSFATVKPNESFASWLMRGYFVSLFGIPLVGALIQFLIGTPVTGGGFILLILMLCIPGYLLTARLGDSATQIFRGRRLDILLMVALPFAVLLCMTPKFYWENLNGDGTHALMSVMLHIYQGLPFWPQSAGSVASYPSVATLTEVFPAANFVRIFGVSEAAIRLAFLPALSVMAALLLALIRRDENTPTSPVAAFGIFMALILYAFVMAFNPTYNPYFADIALPLAREPLIMIGALGFILFFLERRHFWMGAISLVALLTAPNGLILIGFWLAAYFVTQRPLEFRRVFAAGLTILLVLIAISLVQYLFQLAGIVRQSGEFGAKAILARLRYVTFFDFQRIVFWVLPCGILPAISLLFWNRHDRISKALTLMTFAYVAFFYFQAYRILPHHFAPAMVLPLIVFWRLDICQQYPRKSLAGALIGIAMAAWLSWPESVRPHLHTRDLGARILFSASTDQYLDFEEIKLSDDIFDQAFPIHWTDEELKEKYWGEPIAWYYYAKLPKKAGQEITYIVRPISEAPIEGEIMLGSPVDGFAIYTNDLAKYHEDRTRTDLPVSIARWYQVKRSAIFGRGIDDKNRTIIDVAALLGVR